jgi:pimeloyl-ACP methyl ester carboxylesterase
MKKITQQGFFINQIKSTKTMKKLAMVVAFLLTVAGTFGQDITGQWTGILKVQGIQLRVVFNLTKTASGYSSTMDSPDQGVKGIPVSSVSFENSVLKLSVASAGIDYEGTLNKEHIIAGTFKQGGQAFPMELTFLKSEKPVQAITEDKNAVYRETPVTLNTGSGRIFGTLTTPKEFSRGPVALIIAGSGPTDRDCNNSMMKCDAYKKLARELSGKGIATVRYDKRGIAESQAAMKSEADLRFDDYVNDAREWIKLLRKDKRFSTVVVIGHSEGSLIGMIAGASADKFISIAGAGRSGDKVIKEQLGNQPKEIQNMAFPILDSLSKGKRVDQVNPILNALFRPSVQPYLMSWLKYDPQKEISGLSIPVLLIQGTTDIQVTVEDARLLAKANPKSQLNLISSMNHILRTVEGDRQANIATYNNAALPLSDGLVKGISEFISKK